MAKIKEGIYKCWRRQYNKSSLDICPSELNKQWLKTVWTDWKASSKTFLQRLTKMLTPDRQTYNIIP